MSPELLTRLLRGEHISVPERKELGAWPHPPLRFPDLVSHLACVFTVERYFPYELQALPAGTGADEVVIERQAPDRFIVRIRAANAWGGLAGEAERVVSTAEQAAELYLRLHLHLPGDLDSWQVLP